MNICILDGRITKDLELRKTASGQSVVSFTLAVDRDYKAEGQATTDFLECQAWGKTADNLCRYCGKGAWIMIQSHVQKRNYDDKEGNKRYLTEFIVDKVKYIDTRKAKAAEQNEYQQEDSYDAESTLNISSDDLPF